MPGPDELSLFALRLEAIGAPYMVTGATAAILYGQPRVTNDLDVVLIFRLPRRSPAPVGRRRVHHSTIFRSPPPSSDES